MFTLAFNCYFFYLCVGVIFSPSVISIIFVFGLGGRRGRKEGDSRGRVFVVTVAGLG